MSGMLLPSKSSSFLFLLFLSFLKDDHHGGDDGDVDIVTFSHVRNVAAIKVIMMRRISFFSFLFLLIFYFSFFLRFFSRMIIMVMMVVMMMSIVRIMIVLRMPVNVIIAKRVEITKKHGYKIDMKIYRMSPKKKLTECCCSHQIQNQN